MTISEMIEILEEYAEKNDKDMEVFVRFTSPATMDLEFVEPIFEDIDGELYICAD